MPKKQHAPAWREFEQMVARIEADAGPAGLIVKSPDRIRCRITGRLREVDASVQTQVGTTNILVTIECRKRRPVQDVTWVEQLATKKQSLGAARTRGIFTFARQGLPVRSRSLISSRITLCLVWPVRGPG